tara:strand:- start:458 stop:625 length:168 start_codon:yes stop_codon:yes gene_type:complete
MDNISKRQKKRLRNERNKKQKILAEKNKKITLKQLEEFFYNKQREEVGWWFLLGY